MSKYTLYTIMAVLQMFLCTACYEDKGNYDYKDLPKVVYNDKYYPYVLIDEDGNEDTAPGYLTLRYGETIKIKPSYKLSKDADIELKFTWILRSDDTNQEDIVLGHEETLEWKADEAMKGKLLLDIEDATNGTHFLSNISIEVTDPYAGLGLLVLSDKDGKKMLSFVTSPYSDDEQDKEPFEEFINLYEEVNKEPLPNNVIKIHEHYRKEGNSSGAPTMQMAVCDDQLIDFSTSLFKEEIRSDQFFSTPIKNIRDVLFMQWLDLVVDDKGQVYQRRKTTDQLFHSQKFLSEPVKYNGEVLEGIKIIPGLFCGSGRGVALLYDSKHGRYLTMSNQKFYNFQTDKDDSYVGKICEMVSESSSGWPKGFTPLSDMSDYDLIYTGSNNRTDDWGGWQCVSIIREKATGTYYWQKFEITHGYQSPDIYVTNMEQGVLPDALASIITADTKFALPDLLMSFDGKSHPYLFAACGNDLYLYDLEDMAGGVSRALTFDSPIAAICCDRYSGSFITVGLEDGSLYTLRTNGAKNHWSWAEKSWLVRNYIAPGKLGKIQGIYYKSDGDIVNLD